MKIEILKSFKAGSEWRNKGTIEEVGEIRGKELIRFGLAREVISNEIKANPEPENKMESEPENKMDKQNDHTGRGKTSSSGRP